MKTVGGKLIAYTSPLRENVPVGTRVIGKQSLFVLCVFIIVLHSASEFCNNRFCSISVGHMVISWLWFSTGLMSIDTSVPNFTNTDVYMSIGDTITETFLNELELITEKIPHVLC